MGRTTGEFPFEASFEEIRQDPDRYVDAIFACLESEFLVMPRGEGFVEFPVFERGYERLKAATHGFSRFEPDALVKTIVDKPIALAVLRSMLGLTPPEWAYVAAQQTGIPVPQGFVRSLDRKIRMKPETPLKVSAGTAERLQSLLETACRLLTSPVPQVGARQIHRLDKVDTRHGVESLMNLAVMGVPYAMLLYERFLGRPFAAHRDSVSELIGDSLESAIETTLVDAGISFRKTKRAERIDGFDQAPDFMVPSEFDPAVVIEAKITEDDGTARDKVTRIQHLGELSLSAGTPEQPRFEVVACIGGRGFGVRREDMRKMILATRGKVFTAKTLHKLVPCTRLREFKTR